MSSEVKEKICPFMELTPVIKLNSNCIENNCAMWRVQYPEIKREGHGGGKELIFEEGVKTKRSPKQFSYNMWRLEEVGYCGLAGPLHLP